MVINIKQQSEEVAGDLLVPNETGMFDSIKLTHKEIRELIKVTKRREFVSSGSESLVWFTRKKGIKFAVKELKSDYNSEYKIRSLVKAKGIFEKAALVGVNYVPYLIVYYKAVYYLIQGKAPGKLLRESSSRKLYDMWRHIENTLDYTFGLLDCHTGNVSYSRKGGFFLFDW